VGGNIRRGENNLSKPLDPGAEKKKSSGWTKALNLGPPKGALTKEEKVKGKIGGEEIGKKTPTQTESFLNLNLNRHQSIGGKHRRGGGGKRGKVAKKKKMSRGISFDGGFFVEVRVEEK